MSTTAAPAEAPTPILDRLTPMPEQKGISLVRIWIELALSVVIPIPFFWRPPFMTTFLRWAGRNIAELMSSSDWAGVHVILTAFAIALMCLLAIAIHECGHLLVGLALGFRCREIRFGRFSIGRDFRVSIHHDPNAVSLGSAFMIPQHWEKIRLRESLMLLAGPAASFLSGYAAFRLWPTPSLISGSFIGVSFFFAAYNFLPHGLRGHATDGTKIWMMLFQPERALRHVAISRLAAEIDGDVPLEQLSPTDLELATNLKDESAETVWAHTVAFLSAYNRRDNLKAGQLLETALRYSGCALTVAREWLALNAAMFQAARRGRIDLAKLWLAEVPASTACSALRSNIESAIRDSSQPRCST